MMNTRIPFTVYARSVVSGFESCHFLSCAELFAAFHDQLVRPYKMNDQTVNQEIVLKHGGALKQWPMDRISNSSFTEVI